MGKKVDKSVSKERHSVALAEEYDKSAEPYKCNGNFLMDFNELCKKNNMTFIPVVISRPRLPVLLPVVSDSKLEKKGDKKPPVPVPDVELELEVNEGPVEGPPKTYTTKDKFQYFKPSVHVELDSSDKWDTATEVYIRGWKIDGPMMDIFRQCWISLTKLHTINLWNTGLTEETLHTLATFLPQCSNIKNVILDGNSVKEENWSKLLEENSLIQNLSLRFCNITNKGAAGLGHALRATMSANTKLLSLNLAGNLIGDDGAECLAESLRTNRTLLSLILTSNNIGDRGAIKFSETLSQIPLTHEEVVMRRTLMSEKGPVDRKSPLPSRRTESRDRPASVSRSVTTQEKAKQKPAPKKKDLKLKDSKEDMKSPKKEKEDTRSKKEPRGSRGAQGIQNAATGRMSSASSTSDVTKSQSKTKDKKKERGKSILTEPDMTDSVNSDSHDQINPLLDTADFKHGQLWITGNRTLINLNLSRNKIGETGMAALLKAIQYQISLKSDSKSNLTGLMRLVTNKNAVPPDNETVFNLNELMLLRDPFYKAPTISETSIT